MEAYKREFIEFMVRCEVLTFGDFTTKSGRKTPYFVNTGKYRSGTQIARLGEFYADAIQGRLSEGYDVLFGPAYKGIPLAVTTAAALASRGKDVGFCFNRKEAKDHGEGGVLVGHQPTDGERVLIVEDVTTAGTSIRETVPVLRAAAAVELAGLIVSVDRQERGKGERAALAEVGEEFGMPTFAIVTLAEIVEHLSGREIDGRVVLGDADLARIEAYRAEYGAPA
ncbi:MAG: orotate phosphoribosyltransferase [Planctomycetota bacterium]|nr:orotate phosphoribosyltransferase [Planctomycetota bacterium]